MDSAALELHSPGKPAGRPSSGLRLRKPLTTLAADVGMAGALGLWSRGARNPNRKPRFDRDVATFAEQLPIQLEVAADGDARTLLRRERGGEALCCRNSRRASPSWLQMGWHIQHLCPPQGKPTAR